MLDDSTKSGPPFGEQQLEVIASHIVDHNFARVDDFLPLSEVRNLIARFDFLQDAGQLNQAGIGKQQHHQIIQQVRGDVIKWINPEDEDETIQKLFQRIHAVRNYLNKTCFLGLKDLEAHFAKYPVGAFYQRHVDRFQRNPHRVISFVCYLNEAWTNDDGGELCIYQPNKENVEIWPIAGRVVFFLSELEHEVKTAHRERFSITGWMLDQYSNLTFLH